jgi:hypothetical protein
MAYRFGHDSGQSALKKKTVIWKTKQKMYIVRVLWMFQPCRESFCMHVCHKLPFNYWPIFFGFFLSHLSRISWASPHFIMWTSSPSWSTSFTVVLRPLRCHSSTFVEPNIEKQNKKTSGELQTYRWCYNTHLFCSDWIFDIVYWCDPYNQ